jgi:hypothetical protein
MTLEQRDGNRPPAGRCMGEPSVRQLIDVYYDIILQPDMAISPFVLRAETC